jgi:hypothetical protein
VAEIRRITVRSQPGQIVLKTLALVRIGWQVTWDYFSAQFTHIQKGVGLFLNLAAQCFRDMDFGWHDKATPEKKKKISSHELFPGEGRREIEQSFPQMAPPRDAVTLSLDTTA